MQQQGGADAHRRAADRGHYRLGEIEQRAHELEHRTVHAGWRLLEEVDDVVAAGEALLAAGDQHSTNLPVLLRRIQHLGHAAVHGASQGVLLVRAIHAQRQQALLALDQNVLAHGKSSMF
ncbi:hypothetical protein D3C81_1670050 [compost metagenome]